MKVQNTVLILSAFLLICCNDRKDAGIITYQLKRSDFIETINVPGTVQAVSSTPVIAPQSMFGRMTVVQLAGDGAYIRKGDTLCVLSVPELETNYRDILSLIETREAELERTLADNRFNIALLESQLATSRSGLKIASLDSLQMKYVQDTQKKLLELEMRKAVIESQKIEKKLAITRNIGETDIGQKRAMLIQLKMRAQSFLDQIRSMTIIAQREGIVTRTEAPMMMIMSTTGSGSFGGPIREGSVIFGSNAAVLQFPDLSRMQVSADVAEAEFKRIEKGQKVNVTVEASGNLFITGKVNRKSLARSAAQRYSESKVRTYEVIIDLDSCHSKIKPGLSTKCEIVLKEEKDTLFVPTLAIFEKDSSTVVFVKENKKFVPVKVETGSAGSSFTIIAGGLKGYETIALSEPPGYLTTKSR